MTPTLPSDTPGASIIRPLYKAIAYALSGIASCEASESHSEWLSEYRTRLDRLERLLPSGSGIDNGTRICASSTPSRIVLTFGYHHMNEHGYYDGWTEHKAIITPSLIQDFNLRITGRDRNQIKDYLHETYDYALGLDVRADGKTISLEHTHAH